MFSKYQYLLPKPGFRFLPEPCPDCPIDGSRKVGARGSLDSPLVIIGEGPGTEELRHGTPFCGPSGDLLDKCTPEGFDFDHALVLNAMQCRVRTGNPQRDKTLKTKACVSCRNRLLGQIFEYPRKAILALGGWSNGSLVGDYGFKITVKRGVIYSIENPYTGEEIPVIPAVHPAFLLRGGGNVKVFKDDVEEAVSLAFDGYTSVRHDNNWEDPEVKVLYTADSIDEYHNELIRLAQHGELEVAADIETAGFNYLTDRILCVGFYRYNVPNMQDTGVVVPVQSGYTWNVPDITPEALAALKRLLNDPTFRFVWQFGKFDEKFLKQANLIGEETINKEDIGLISYALSEATKDHDLDEQAKNVLGAPDHKDALKQWVPKKTDSFELVPPPVLWDYLAKDTKKTYLLYEARRELVRQDPALEKLYTRTLIPASHLLAQIEEYGIYVDWDYVRINRSGAVEEDVARGLVTDLESEKGLEWELEDLGNQLERLAGWKVNALSPGEVATLLYDQFELKIKGKRPDGTAKESLDKLPSHPAVKLIKKYRSTNKMLSTYVKAIEQLAIDNRIHTTLKLHVTTTGRLSSSEPNIQNIPREARFRRMYRARPGCVLIEGDYNSAELRMLAVLSGDEFLTEVFLDDKRNLHDEVSVAMYGPNWTDDQRIRAKAINFGIPYGREAVSIAEEFDIPVAEAQRLIDAWFARAPRAAQFLAKCGRAPLEGKSLVTVFGRKRRPGVVSQERMHGLKNEFRNFFMQSTISDFTLHSAMRMLPRLKKEGAHLVNLVHDSTITECPSDSEDRKQQIAGIIKETMESVPKEWIITPIEFKVDMKIGTHWGLAKKFKLALAA